VRALEYPIGDIAAAVWPEEAETDTMKSSMDTHMAGGGGSVVGREDVAAEQSRDDNQHEKLFVVLDRLEDNEFVVNKRDAVLANIVAVGRM
jgi:hypothetical protein